MSPFATLKNYTLFVYYNLRKKNISDTDHVARYLRPSDIDNDVVLATGFEYKKNKDNGELKEKELSVNWLEFFHKGASIDENVRNVREAFQNKGYTLKRNGRFAVLNVETMREEVEEGTSAYTELVSLIAKHTPFRNDLSHSSIFGMPFDSEGEFLVSTILANYVNDTQLFPARN